MYPHAVLPRYAAMCGFFEIPPMAGWDKQIPGLDTIDIPDEIVPKILALHFSERATNDLRAMGEGMGKLSVSVPSSINVWQHLKGESALAGAAESLARAAKSITKHAAE